VIFVGSSFWIGISAARDSRHEATAALLGKFRTSALLTSNHMRVACVSERLEEESWRWLQRHDEREYSFVDATSFALMRSLRLRDAFAFDGDFAAAGFTELRA